MEHEIGEDGIPEDQLKRVRIELMIPVFLKIVAEDLADIQGYPLNEWICRAIVHSATLLQMATIENKDGT